MIEVLLSRLTKVRVGSKQHWMACCPAHADRSPSLSIRQADDGKILIKCFAGCPTDHVLSAVRLSYSDLFPSLESRYAYAERVVAHQKFSAAKIKAEVERCQLRLDMAKDLRQQGIKLNSADLETERQAFIKLRRLQQGFAS